MLVNQAFINNFRGHETYLWIGLNDRDTEDGK